MPIALCGRTSLSLYAKGYLKFLAYIALAYARVMGRRVVGCGGNSRRGCILHPTGLRLLGRRHGVACELVLAQKSNRPWNRFADEACGRRFLIIRPKR